MLRPLFFFCSGHLGHLGHLGHEGVEVEVISPDGDFAVGEFECPNDGYFEPINALCQEYMGSEYSAGVNAHALFEKTFTLALYSDPKAAGASISYTR